MLPAFLSGPRARSREQGAWRRTLIGTGLHEIGGKAPLLMYEHSVHCWVVAMAEDHNDLRQVEENQWVFQQQHEVGVDLVLDPPGWTPPLDAFDDDSDEYSSIDDED